MTCTTGGAHLTINYFWLNMISLCWASHAAANPAAGPPPTSPPINLHLQLWLLPLTPHPLLPQTALRLVGSACLKTRRTVLQWRRTRIKWSSISSCCCRRRRSWVRWGWLWRWLCVIGFAATCTPCISHAHSADEDLAAKYYSQALLDSDSARTSMVLADLQPMPTRV